MAVAGNIIYGASPVKLFQGYRHLTSTAMGTAVTGTTVPTNNIGGVTTVKYKVCLGLSDVNQTLEIDVSNLSEKRAFLDQLTLTEYSTCIVIYAKHPVATETAEKATLLPSVKPPVTPSMATDFVHHYGEGYVSSETLGGEYYAVYAFYTECSDDQKCLLSEMKAQGILSPTEINPTALQKKINDFTTALDVVVSFQHCVSGFPQPNLPDADNILSYAVNFPTIDITTPVVISFTTTGYEACPDLDPAVFSRNSVDGSDLRRSLAKLRHLLDVISSIKRVYEFYGSFAGDVRLSQTEAEAVSGIKSIEAAMAAVSLDPLAVQTDGFHPSKLTPLSYGMPRLGKPSLQRSPSFTNGIVDAEKSKPFDCGAVINGDIFGFLRQRTQISSVTLTKADNMDESLESVVVKYVNNETSAEQKMHLGPPASRRGGRTDDLTETFSVDFDDVDDGDDSSADSRELLIPSGDFINSISGYCNVDGVVSNLHFTLTNCQCVSVGRRVGTGFYWKVPANSVVVGFCGRYNDIGIVSIQAVYATLVPTSWESTE